MVSNGNVNYFTRPVINPKIVYIFLSSFPHLFSFFLYDPYPANRIILNGMKNSDRSER